MSARSKHPKPEGEALLKAAEQQKWRVVKGKKYFKIYCPCPDKHKETVHLTPSNPNYVKEKRKYLEHYTCWVESE